jgi:activator of HSP90 ATPase
VCLLVGVLAGSAVANTARPAPTTVTTPPVTTIRAPVACVNAIAGLAKVSLRQFRIIDLYRDALHNAHVASWARADAMYQHMTDGTVGVKHAADVCVKATKGASG